MAIGGRIGVPSVQAYQDLGVHLVSRGDGNGRVYFQIEPEANCTIGVTGAARLYRDEPCTGTPFTTLTQTPNLGGGITPIFLKITSGTGWLYSSTKRLRAFGLFPLDTGLAANTPLVEGDFSNWTFVQDLILNSLCNFTSSITKLVNVINLQISTTYNYGAITGSVSNIPNLATVVIHNYPPLRLEGSSMLITGNITRVNGVSGEFVDDEKISIKTTGTLNDPFQFFYSTGHDGHIANLDSWTKCYYIETDCPNVSVTTVRGMTHLGYFQLDRFLFRSAVVNQILSDFRYNAAVTKTYNDMIRIVELSGLVGSEPPTGQGLVDKQWLIDYIGPQGQRFYVTTR